MPKNIIDYSNTVIYKIVCNNLDIKDVYVGHTTHFIKRKQRHKRCCTIPESKHYNLKVYQVIRENGNWDNWSMIEIEKYKCNDRNEAIARERYWYETLNSTMNTNYPSRSHREYLQTHKQEIAEKSKISVSKRIISLTICSSSCISNFFPSALFLKNKSTINTTSFKFLSQASTNSYSFIKFIKTKTYLYISPYKIF